MVDPEKSRLLATAVAEVDNASAALLQLHHGDEEAATDEAIGEAAQRYVDAINARNEAFDGAAKVELGQRGSGEVKK